MALRHIRVRTHNKFAMQASLHGINVKLMGEYGPSDEEKTRELTPEQEARMERAMLEAQSRRKAKVARRV